MRIGFDAKRAYHNQTGLGHYSRTLIRSLATGYPQHEYVLFNTSSTNRFDFNEQSNISEVLPGGWLSKQFPAVWRSSWIKHDFKRYALDLYHGLSHELPAGMHTTGIPSVVTIHDLIFETHPSQYKKMDRLIYRKKFQYACKAAHKVIAISEQTKRDLVNLYHILPEKIEVCYQSCNPAFVVPVSAAERESVRLRYGLPEHYFLYVGSIIERKNLLGVCKAMQLLQKEVELPLVIIGNGGTYKQQVKAFIEAQQLQDRCIFLSDTERAQTAAGFQTATDFPAIYQQATALIYPSFSEGFGIPVLEALWSRIPVITSNVSCLPEAGGPGAFYVNPAQPEEIAAQAKRIVYDTAFVQEQQKKSDLHLQQFTNAATATRVMEVYQQVLSSVAS